MDSAKQTMADIISRQPDDSTYEEILRELAYAGLVQKGIEDSDAGRTLSDEDMQRKIESWGR